MQLKSLMVDTKSAWIEYPEFEGFEVEVVNLGREKLVNLRKSCMVDKFDRKSHQKYSELDEKKFVTKFTEATVKNWRGLKLDYLEQMILVDISDQDPESELEYSPENADALVSNSSDFDKWLNDVVFDLERFRTVRDGKSVGETGDVAD
jgi:hypothetical protein